MPFLFSALLPSDENDFSISAALSLIRQKKARPSCSMMTPNGSADLRRESRWGNSRRIRAETHFLSIFYMWPVRVSSFNDSRTKRIHAAPNITLTHLINQSFFARFAVVVSGRASLVRAPYEWDWHTFRWRRPPTSMPSSAFAGRFGISMCHCRLNVRVHFLRLAFVRKLCL